MKRIVIENPIINLPFQEPKEHFRFTQDGTIGEIDEKWCISQYFVLIPRAKKYSAKQLSFETKWIADRVEENKGINHIREPAAVWRQGGYAGITKTTLRL